MNKSARFLLTVALVWDTTWKAIAVWTAVRRKDYRWIVPLSLVNSIGLLPIVYLKVFAAHESDSNGEP